LLTGTEAVPKIGIDGFQLPKQGRQLLLLLLLLLLLPLLLPLLLFCRFCAFSTWQPSSVFPCPRHWDRRTSRWQ